MRSQEKLNRGCFFKCSLLHYITFFSFFLLLCTGCQKSAPSDKQMVRLSLENEPATLDPRKARDLTSCSLIRFVFEGLTRTSIEGKTELALATDVEVSQSGMVYTFHLRPSQWANKDPLTAYDFARSWKEILDPKFPSDIAYQLFCIKNGRSAKKGEVSLADVGISTPDSLTLIVELEAPVPYFLDLVSQTPFFPTHPQDVTIGNGPFLLKSWRHSDSLTFVKNENYWQADSVKLNEIQCLHATADTGIRMFKEGKLDWTGSPLSTLSSDAIADLKNQGILKVQPFSGTAFFRVNVNPFVKEKDNLLSHCLFRRALAMSIDRKTIAQYLLQGGQQPALSLVPPEMGLSAQYFEDNHPDEASSYLEELFNELDLKKNQLDPITLSFVGGERNSALAQVIQKEWENQLGIPVKLEPMEAKVYYQKISQKDYQIALGSWTADFNDPINFLEVFKFKESGTNNTGWENQRFVDLLSLSSICKEKEERKQCLSAAERILMEQMPIIPLYHLSMNYLVRDELKAVALSSTGGLDFRWAYWEK